MVAKRQPKPSKKKNYYKSPSAESKLRHRLADGTPTTKLLYYMHDKKRLRKDILELAEAAEKLGHVKELLEGVTSSGSIDELGESATALKDLTANGARTTIDRFIKEVRKALVLKTMKEPEEE